MFLLLSSIALAANGLAPPLAIGIHSSAIIGDEQSTFQSGILGRFSKDTHKAVQEALQGKGYYSGPVDGKVGTATKDAVFKFRSEKGILAADDSWLKLDARLVHALFGIPGFDVIDWRDQVCLMAKLRKTANSNNSDACGSSRPEADAPEPEPQPAERAAVPLVRAVRITCAADTPECLETPDAAQRQ